MQWTTRGVAWMVAGILTAAGCQGVQPPVPVAGDLMLLAGQWDGEYGGRESGRHGSIMFTLAAGADTAYGDVLMIPREWENPPGSRTGDPNAPGQPLGQAPQPLKIAFVWAEGGRVEGRLAPYRDPECGCLLTTTFTGRLESANQFEGTFVSLHAEMGKETRGWWRATRRTPD
ncbi:MAG: hypothetical protein KJZ47_13765 [Gemmatimonadales bacterium]|nr:hypothetical protein [Gemmatimonadales bacterium]